MSYYQGFLLAVPEKNKATYRDMAAGIWPLFRDYGAVGMCETWGVDVPDGKVTSFPMAVKLEEGEAVVFAWLEWPDKETCDTGTEAMMKDPRFEGPANSPFDGMRMMWGGFEPVFRAGTADTGS